MWRGYRTSLAVVLRMETHNFFTGLPTNSNPKLTKTLHGRTFVRKLSKPSRTHSFPHHSPPKYKIPQPNLPRIHSPHKALKGSKPFPKNKHLKNAFPRRRPPPRRPGGRSPRGLLLEPVEWVPGKFELKYCILVFVLNLLGKWKLQSIFLTNKCVGLQPEDLGPPAEERGPWHPGIARIKNECWMITL